MSAPSAPTPAPGPPRARRWAAGALPVMAAAALVLAGCSSSSNSAGTTTTTAGPTTTARPGPPTSGGSSTTGGSTTTAAGPTTCQPNGLAMAAGMGNGGAGTIEMVVTMTNTSAAPCTLDGYPGMQLLDSSGAKLPTTVVRGGGPGFLNPAANQPPAPVTLQPGQKASFSLSYEDVPVGTETSCPTSAKAQITPPNDFSFAVIALQASACGGGTIHVSPVYAGT